MIYAVWEIAGMGMGVLGVLSVRPFFTQRG
jgi:hypothetical protein